MEDGASSEIQSLALGWKRMVTYFLEVGAIWKRRPSNSMQWSLETRREARREKCRSSREAGGQGRRAERCSL